MVAKEKDANKGVGAGSSKKRRKEIMSPKHVSKLE